MKKKLAQILAYPSREECEDHERTRERWLNNLAWERHLEKVGAEHTTARLFLEQGATVAGYMHRGDAIAERHVLWSSVPEELRQARELVQVAIACARSLEAKFLGESGAAPGDQLAANDPDAREALAFVTAAHRHVTKHGPTPGQRGEAEVNRPHGYTHLTEAEQKTWRKSFMLFLDAAVASGSDMHALYHALFLEHGHLLPPEVHFDAPMNQAALQALLSAWADKKRGPKKAGGKYAILAGFLREWWGCELTEGQLKPEHLKTKNSVLEEDPI